MDWKKIQIYLIQLKLIWILNPIHLFGFGFRLDFGKSNPSPPLIFRKGFLGKDDPLIHF